MITLFNCQTGGFLISPQTNDMTLCVTHMFTTNQHNESKVPSVCIVLHGPPPLKAIKWVCHANPWGRLTSSCYLQLPRWLTISLVAWCLIRWFANTEKSMVVHDTKFTNRSDVIKQHKTEIKILTGAKTVWIQWRLQKRKCSWNNKLTWYRQWWWPQWQWWPQRSLLWWWPLRYLQMETKCKCHYIIWSASHHNWCTGTLLNKIITAQWERMGM